MCDALARDTHGRVRTSSNCPLFALSEDEQRRPIPQRCSAVLRRRCSRPSTLFNVRAAVRETARWKQRRPAAEEPPLFFSAVCSYSRALVL
ncbi:hypothetical protein SRHO_G00241540 [Serrasalmus rhombeus]